MYKINFGFGAFKQSKYFLTYGEALQYCGFFKWNIKRIKAVH